jgi:transcriptional regulator with XRE-family HTH domain
MRRPGKPKISIQEREIGKRIRLRRLELKLSQTALGRKLGVTFQQVQKYESGTNRVTATRLHEVAKALDAPLAFFLGADDTKTRIQTALFADDVLAVRMLKAFAKIQDKQVRQKIIALAEGLAAQSRR